MVEVVDGQRDEEVREELARFEKKARYTEASTEHKPTTTKQKIVRYLKWCLQRVKAACAVGATKRLLTCSRSAYLEASIWLSRSPKTLSLSQKLAK